MKLNTLNMRTGKVFAVTVGPRTTLEAVRTQLLPWRVRWDPKQVQFFLAKHTDSSGQWLLTASDDAYAVLSDPGPNEIRPSIRAMLRKPRLDMESTIRDVFGTDFKPDDKYVYLLYLPPYRCVLLRWFDYFMGVPDIYRTPA